jgi:hypothetical protein
MVLKGNSGGCEELRISARGLSLDFWKAAGRQQPIKRLCNHTGGRVNLIAPVCQFHASMRPGLSKSTRHVFKRGIRIGCNTLLNAGFFQSSRFRTQVPRGRQDETRGTFYTHCYVLIRGSSHIKHPVDLLQEAKIPSRENFHSGQLLKLVESKGPKPQLLFA